MTKLTIKSKGIKGTTFEAESLTVLRTLDFYAANTRAFCFYKNAQGWQKLSAVVAKQYAHIIGNCERVVIAVIPRRFKVKAINGFPKHHGFFSLAAKRNLPEQRLPYTKAMDIRYFRKQVAKGKVPAPVFNLESIPQAKLVSLETMKLIRYRAEIAEYARRTGDWAIEAMRQELWSPRKLYKSFEDRLCYHLGFARKWPLDLMGMTDDELGSEASSEAWASVWERQRKEFLEDLEAYRKSLEPKVVEAPDDVLCLGRFDAPTLVKVLKEAKKHTAQLPKDFIKGFTKAHLIHIRNIGTGIQIIPTDSVGYETEEQFILDGLNRHNLDGFMISLALEQLHNTSAYPAVLDLEKDVVSLEVNFTRKILTVRGANYSVNLKPFVIEREEIQHA